MAAVQYEYFHAFGKWEWWIRGTNGKIIAKCMRRLATKTECFADIESIRRAGVNAPIVLIGESHA